MTRKLTRITPLTDGYAVVVAQEPNQDGKPGAFIGCFLQTPECADDGDMTTLTEAMSAYFQRTQPELESAKRDERNRRNVRISQTRQIADMTIAKH